VSVRNTSGKTSLTIDDSNDAVNTMTTVTDHSVQFGGRPRISYGTGVTSLKVLTGSGTDDVFVDSTAAATPVTLVCGGYDNVNVGSAGSVQSILQPITVTDT